MNYRRAGLDITSGSEITYPILPIGNVFRNGWEIFAGWRWIIFRTIIRCNIWKFYMNILIILWLSLLFYYYIIY